MANEPRTTPQNCAILRIFRGLHPPATERPYAGFRNKPPRTSPSCFHCASTEAKVDVPVACRSSPFSPARHIRMLEHFFECQPSLEHVIFHAGNGCPPPGRRRPICPRPSQPSLRSELGQINTGRRIPSVCGVSGAELLCDFLVAVRNAQWRVCGGTALLCNWRMPRIHQSRSCRRLSRPLRRRGGFCHFRFRTPRDSFAAALSGFSALVRVNPCGHSGRVCLGFVAYRNTFFPRYALGE